MTLTTISTNLSHGGVQGVYSHASTSTNTDMTFSVFVPPHEDGETLPIIWYLSGLTCTHANVTDKGEFREACTRLGVILIAPDTSPRGENVPDDPDKSWDFGLGAGFYVDATQAPFDKYYKMCTYLEKELPELIVSSFPVDMSRQSIMGHSMGGHGALTIGLRNSDRFKSVSAFAPIVSPLNCPWGEKALTGYIGPDKSNWREYDACALIEDGARVSDLLVDQGSKDNFLEEQLKPELLKSACETAGQKLTLRMQEGYDHSYYFISTFMADHIEWHAKKLKA
ncbi:S-formylglutathione hydrolase [Hirschia baltica]|uniref:S-formylglutathione hydrolase n=1 Tax=Hirschia baltica (strain ATCC 49814 / DSM 5838 / IFAM 1418) TaxID=582402 RepID=C6XR09_HIRBI|nr:S-formylglutathione hydrolase [Hirschia baltica]ACT60540.1 S-formylglutathione hydrolase [Hirschia baltica ATCC 49814]